VAVRNLRRDANEAPQEAAQGQASIRRRPERARGRGAEAHRPHIAEIDTLVASKEAEIMAV
jgi:ribosome recycling factor